MSLVKWFIIILEEYGKTLESWESYPVVGWNGTLILIRPTISSICYHLLFLNNTINFFAVLKHTDYRWTRVFIIL